MQSQPLDGFVTCPRGLEDVVAGELRAPTIAAGDIRAEASGVSFRGDATVFHRANLWLRSGIRVLGRIGRARVTDADELYALALDIDWLRYMRLEQTFSVEARVWDSGITHSKYAALRVKDALCDQFRKRRGGKRPNVQIHGADLPLFVYIYKNVATIYRDWSGETLHKRGYRDVMHKSSLNESVAAGMLTAAGYDGSPLLDPMCGAGTLPIEAALIATQRAPGLFRKHGGFPFERWPDHDGRTWRRTREDAERAARPNARPSIAANDVHDGALSLARRDATRAGVADCIQFSSSPIDRFRPPFRPDVVVVNPPWGERLDTEDLDRVWKELRLFLKEHCAPSTTWVLSGASRATRGMGLKASRKLPVRIGKVDSRILRYDILPPREAAPAADPH